MGPMRAAGMFVDSLARAGLLTEVSRVRVELFGSLGATGRGHGSDGAVMLGLCGALPESVDTQDAPNLIAAIRSRRWIRLPNGRRISFDEDTDLVLHQRLSLPEHPNGMTFSAFGSDNSRVSQRTYYSVGGGSVREPGRDTPEVQVAVPYPFRTGEELLAHCLSVGWSVSAVMRANERARRTDTEIDEMLMDIWRVMAECVRRGCYHEGILPGGLGVPRRAKTWHDKLTATGGAYDPLTAMDWVSLFALAVNEENAAGGRIVTAPTNGAAGIVPAVLHYYRYFVPGADDAGVMRFLLAAGAIGVVLKETGSISGAEVGCQGEVGSACAMAAAGLTEVLGGSPEQVENAAEIGLEHHLGLTCDPIGGLVQIPCIERNAIAAVKAISAARISLLGNGTHIVSLDNAIKTMRATGADMSEEYKETSRGGLAVNVTEC